MELIIHSANNLSVAELISDEVEIKNEQDALDLMGNADYLGARKIIVHEKNIACDFFDLKTRLAGEILQKFSNYQVALAIVGDFESVASKSLRDFIYESNTGDRILFLSTVEDALTRFGLT